MYRRFKSYYFHLFRKYRLVGKAEDYFKCLEYAAVAKLANAGVSKASDGNIVQVQVLSAAPKRFPFNTEWNRIFFLEDMIALKKRKTLAIL